jgi:AAA domain (dynein-related subfamily)/Mrr N-terminal domain
MRPVLELHADGRAHRGAELEEILVSRLAISDADRQLKNKSGVRTLTNRIAWARVDLSQAGLLSRPARGVTQITERGREVLTSPPEVIDRQYLRRFPEFMDYLHRDATGAGDNDGVSREAVLEALEEAARLGRDAFLEKYGFRRALSYIVRHDGAEFDSKALYGAAYGYAHPDHGPLRSSDFSGGAKSVVRRLKDLGFDVRGDPEAEAQRSGWDILVEIAARARREPDFDKRERDYKLEIAEAIQEVIRQARGRDGGDWLEELQMAWQRQYPSGPYNLTNWRQHAWFTGTVAGDERVRVAVAGFGDPAEDPVVAFSHFSEAVEAAGSGDGIERNAASVLGIGSLLAFGADPTRLPLIRVRVFERCERAVGFGSARAGSIPERYAHHLRFADEARARMEEAGIEIRDMLDVQSLLWIASEELEQSGDPPSVGSASAGNRVWWVNQGASFARARAGGYLWAPKQAKDGSSRQDWDSLTEVHAGDLVINYSQGSIRGVSTVETEAFDAPRPAPMDDQSWSDDGRRLNVRYRDVASPIELQEIPDEWRREDGGPFNRNGGVKQGYLYRLTPEFVARIADRFPQLGMSIHPGERASVDDLAAELYVPAAFLRESIDLLDRKGQLTFYGPPGTGKTFIARKLARFLTESDPQRLEVVQFHPSYSYEDFVQGYRPQVDSDGQMTYRLKPGPLLRLAERARQASPERHVLLIDEINRGNLPRIFGELLFLLEYRNERVALLYGDADFELPDNLCVIGTMNTADRSIGLIDSALRRRFHFQALFPARPPVDEVLTRWLAENAPTMVGVADDVDRLNARLRERFGEHIQVGHSYFMQRDLDQALLEQIWQADILPFLEEQLFGHEGELSDFSLEAVRDQPESPAEEFLPVGDEPDEDDHVDGVREHRDRPDVAGA